VAWDGNLGFGSNPSHQATQVKKYFHINGRCYAACFLEIKEFTADNVGTIAKML
jgi:hypothetical protein